MPGTGGALFKGASEERKEVERFVDALRLWMGKRPLYKLERNEGCLDWSHRHIGDGNHHVRPVASFASHRAVQVRLG